MEGVVTSRDHRGLTVSVCRGVISLMAGPCGEKRDGARPAKCAQAVIDR